MSSIFEEKSFVLFFNEFWINACILLKIIQFWNFKYQAKDCDILHKLLDFEALQNDASCQ